MDMATDEQVEFCRKMFRKSKLFYRCLETDAELRDEVFQRTGFDLDELEVYEVEEIVNELPDVFIAQRGWEKGDDGWWPKKDRTDGNKP